MALLNRFAPADDAGTAGVRPGFAGQVLAELALSLVASSLAILALLAPAASLSALLTVAVAVWADMAITSGRHGNRDLLQATPIENVM